ncbi:hypothetical protein N5C81_21960 [Rhizobium pusense]|uniref:hypothetical protein n=1 Tax=Agrobacterium pusense TaxID=648995 RepID=UPI00244C0977|nr:hypothetical protein [Agrobacterium pusense]MDH1270284.1 hypothetical protein [Agrobacterium pusense]
MAENRINLRDRYEEAVARFGIEQVERGNEIMVEVEFAREAIDRVKAGKLPAEHAASYQITYERELARAAIEALNHQNEYLLDLARDDGDLAVAIGRERRSRPEQAPIPGSPEAPIHIGHTAEQQLRYAVSGNREANPLETLQTSEEVFKAVQAAVAERLNHLNARLTDQDSPHFISEDSYVTRNEARAERQFLADMKDQLDKLEPGGSLDLSRTETDYGYDPEEAATDRMSGLEYETATARAEREHESHVESVASLLEQLRARGVTVDTSFKTVEPTGPSAAEWAAQDAELVEDQEQEYDHLRDPALMARYYLNEIKEADSLLASDGADGPSRSEAKAALEEAITRAAIAADYGNEFVREAAKTDERLAARIIELGQQTPASRREIMDSKPDPLPLFTELYDDVVRTADGVPVGALHRHAEGRLQQTYAVLALIEQGREIGLLPKDGEFVATGARVQDKRTSRMYPAAHRLPADLSIKYDGQLVRLTDFFEEGLDRTWIDKNIFASTDRIHRLANVADQWCEDAGMKTTLVKAANAVLDGKMSARQAMDDIVQPGYAAAVATAREKVERNFSWIERQALSQRIVTIQGQPFRLPEPTALKVKDLPERAAAKDVMERTLAAYSEVSELSPFQRMKSAMAATAIIDNEKRAIAEGGRDRLLPPGMAAIEAEHARREARASLQREMDVIEQLAGKAREAVAAANDISRPLSSRQSAMNDAMAYGDRMKVAWTALQKERGPQIMERMEQRVRHCGLHGQRQLAELRSSFAAPPRVVRDVAGTLEDTRDNLKRQDRLDQDRRAQERRENVVQFGPRPEF